MNSTLINQFNSFQIIKKNKVQSMKRMRNRAKLKPKRRAKMMRGTIKLLRKVCKELTSER